MPFPFQSRQEALVLFLFTSAFPVSIKTRSISIVPVYQCLSRFYQGKKDQYCSYLPMPFPFPSRQEALVLFQLTNAFPVPTCPLVVSDFRCGNISFPDIIPYSVRPSHLPFLPSTFGSSLPQSFGPSQLLELVRQRQTYSVLCFVISKFYPNRIHRSFCRCDGVRTM